MSNSICKEESCKTRSVYNIPGEKKGIYCKSHKLDGMINITLKRRCNELDCKKYPSFNFSNNAIPLYCNDHKKDNMINIITKRCIYDNCNTIPIYNYKGLKKGIYCKHHKLSDMINVKDNICIEEGCTIRANYNIKGNKKGLYCKIHMKDGMIDVKNIKCIYEDCKTRPVYNYEDQTRAIYCAKHKLENMINIIDNKCTYKNCNTIATFNYDKCSKALYCSKHMLDSMIDIRSRQCLTPLCNTRVHSDKYNGYCLRCFIHLFPDQPVSKNYKTKERATVEYIMNSYPNISINLDKPINDGCSRKRPDLLIDLGYQVIICEIDENQHIRYDCSCENKRIMELSQDVLHRPIIFIRFNPDQYLDHKNDNVKSCWVLNKKGICIVPINKKKEWEERLLVLKEMIQYWIEHKSDKLIEIIQLFYDQTNRKKEKEEKETDEFMIQL